MLAHIVFISGDEASPVIDALYNRESADSVVYHGPDDESVTRAIQTLTGWDYGDYDDVSDTTGAGTSDDEWTEGVYILTANLGLGYVSLSRVLFPGDRVRMGGHLRAGADDEPVYMEPVGECPDCGHVHPDHYPDCQLVPSPDPYPWH